MGIGHGTKIATDGLVFYYDIGNTIKSWKGRPSTNVVTNTNLDTGWSKGYCTDINLNDTSVKKPQGVTSPVVSFTNNPAQNACFWYSYGDYAPQADNTTYYISVWARTSGKDFPIAAYTGDNSETGRKYTNYITLVGDDTWQKLEWNAITTNNPNDSDSLSFRLYTDEVSNFPPIGQKIYLCAPYMTTESHSPYTQTTRTNTEALTDISVNNNTITASSLTYSADNSFTFNGSNNYISTTLPINNSNPYTILMLVRPDTLSADSYRTSTNRKTPLKCNGQWNPGIWVTQTTIRSHAKTEYVDTNINWSDLRPTMIGMMFDGTNVYNIFDGEIVSRDNVTSYAPGTNTQLLIGAESTGAGALQWDGDIYCVQIYDRELSQSEIQRNYSALKGRFL